MRSLLPSSVTGLFVWTCCPATAQAHLVSSGLGPFYDGVTHFFISPEDFLLVCVLSFLAGQNGRSCGRTLLFTLPAAWWIGASLCPPLAPSFIPIISAALLIVLGILVAGNRHLPINLFSCLGLTCGLFHGMANGMARTGMGSAIPAALGISCSVFVVVALVTGQVIALRGEWSHIAVRVAGSWIAAIGMLMLGWIMRP